MVNYLVLLGWNDGSDNEPFNLNDLEKVFSVDGIQKAGARFNYEKARWVNHQYIAKTKNNILAKNTLISDELLSYPSEKHENIISLLKERLYTLKDFKKEISFLKEPDKFDEKAVAKLKAKNPQTVLYKILSLVDENEDGFKIKELLYQWAEEENISFGVVMQSLRLSLIGNLTGPDIFSVCSLLGKAVTLKRVSNLINHLK